MSEYYITNVGRLVNVLQDLGVGLDTFNIKVNKDYLGKILFGLRDESKINNKNLQNTITVHWKKISLTLGGVMIENFKRGNLEGITYLGDGECEIDMSTAWIVESQIEAKDFRNGVEKFYKGKKAANTLQRASSIISKLARKHPEHFMRCGRIWLCNKEWIDNKGAFNRERDSVTSKRTTAAHAHKIIRAA